MQKLGVSLLALVLSVAVAGAAAAAPRTLRTTLTGDQEVPPVETTANGTFLITFDPGLTEARFDLRVRNGDGITQAHLHCAAAGVNGPVIAFLFGPADPPENVQGRLAVGTITNDDVIPTEGEPCGREINNLASLYAAMLDGLIYANVHSTDNPGGVVRGQLFP
jgi:hypothetical protein